VASQLTARLPRALSIRAHLNWTNAAFAVIGLEMLRSLTAQVQIERWYAAMLFSWFMLGIVAFSTAKRWPRSVVWVPVAALPIAISLVAEFAGGTGRAYGLLGNPNWSAGLMVLSTMAVLPQRRTWPLAVLFIMAELYTGSRWGTSVLALGIAASLAFKTLRMQRAAVIGLACLALCAWQPAHIVYDFRLFEINSPTKLAQETTARALGDLPYYLRKPGYDARSAPVPLQLSGVRLDGFIYHFTPLQVSHDAGWPAALAWLFLMASTVRVALRDTKDRRTLVLVLSALALTVLDVYFWWPGTLVPVFWTILGSAHAKEERIEAT
jgi:hypothetical protein